jgi:integrase
MAKTLTEASLTTRTARNKLPVGAHFRGIDPEVHLGYRKGVRGGLWFVRWRAGQGYRQNTIGIADDELREGTLDYAGAVTKARRTVEQARKEARAAADGPALTIRAAIETYVATRDKRESERRKRKVNSDAWRLARYVIGREERGGRPAIAPTALADKVLHTLREADLQTWRSHLPETLKATSRRRLINDLKAALNGAYAKHRGKLDPTLPGIIQHGLKEADEGSTDDAVPLARDNQILTDTQIGALIRAAGEIDADEDWGGDLYRMVVVLAGTGARFSQVARMRVGDVQRAQRRLQVPASRKGKRKGGAASTAVAVGQDVLDVLQPAVTGRRSDAPLLERWRAKQVGAGKDGIKWERDKRGPWQSASEIVRPWAAIKERAGLPGAIPYALRHSSIVRGIRAGLPIRLVAAMHDTSVQMIEKHYSKWIVDGLDDLAARAVVSLVPQSAKKIVKMSGRGR